MSAIEDVINITSEATDTNTEQAGRITQGKATLEQILGEHLERFGPGGITAGRLEMAITQADVIHGLILGSTVEMESLNELLSAIGDS